MSDNEVFIASLENFIQATDGTVGVSLKEIGAGRELCVRTLNSEYFIYIIDPDEGKVRVRGGKKFPKTTECIFSGSNFGGSMMKMRWIGIGMFMEFSKDKKNITTSQVTFIGLVTPKPRDNSIN